MNAPPLPRRGTSRAAARRGRLARVPAALLALALLGACAPAQPTPPRIMSYAHPVPPEQTYDLHRAEPLTAAQMAAQLAGVRLLFLGEHHTEPRSHAFQREVLAQLADSGRPVTVALEMFPPEADAALEDWRQGRLDERTFLERSGWYEHWGFAWAHYRDLFLLIRDRHLAVHGVNAARAVRNAVRADQPDDLPADVRALLGPLDDAVAPHEAYVLDALQAAGHGAGMAPDSPTFRRFYRVQRMWDRIMGVRAARLAEAQPADGITVLIVGAGHVAYGLGANLQAARTAALPALTEWEAVVDAEALDAQGRYAVPVGVADWVRVYVRSGEPPDYPSLAPLRLEEAEGGVRVQAVHAFGETPLKALHAGDVVRSLNGVAPRSPAALRLAYEQLPFDRSARFAVTRDGQALTVEVTPHRDAP